MRYRYALCDLSRRSRADLEAEARGEGETLARHADRLHDLARRRQLDVTAEYREIVSGSKLADRPKMLRLLDDVAAGKFDGVLCVTIDRLTRGDLTDQGRILNTFKYSGTRIITPDHDYDLAREYDEDGMLFSMMMARQEYRHIRKRMQAGVLASVHDGCWLGAPPFGYRRAKLPRGRGWTLVPDPVQAPLVRLAFRMSADGAGYYQITAMLNASGARTRYGCTFQPSGVARILHNPVYKGFVRWQANKKETIMQDGQTVSRIVPNSSPLIVPGLHEPLVSADLWDAVQKAIKSHDRVPVRAAYQTANPLAGLLFCAQCGRAMIRNHQKARPNDYYYCLTPGCPCSGAPVDVVERSVLDAVSAWALDVPDDDPANDAAARAADRAHALAAARANVERLQAQRARIFDAYEAGVYDLPEFVRRRDAKDAEIAAARALCDDLAAQPPDPAEIIRQNRPQIRRVLDAYALAPSAAEQNALLKTIIDRIEYDKTHRCSRTENAADFLTLTLHPLLPKN